MVESFKIQGNVNSFILINCENLTSANEIFVRNKKQTCIVAFS